MPEPAAGSEHGSKTPGSKAPRPTEARSTTPRSTAEGPGRVLVFVYIVFTLAAGARSGVQIATRFDEAPLAYLLSALAAVIYLSATIGLARGSRRVALASCTVELAGVLTVGVLSLADPHAFPDATVWSGFGSGYGYVPLVLPVLGLIWLRRTAPARARPSA